MATSTEIKIVVSKEAQAAIDIIKASPEINKALLKALEKVSPLFDSEFSGGQFILTPSKRLIDFMSPFIQAPAWEAFLKDTFNGNEEHVAEIQRFFGTEHD